jgi:hypothetical protein
MGITEIEHTIENGLGRLAKMQSDGVSPTTDHLNAQTFWHTLS